MVGAGLFRWPRPHFYEGEEHDMPPRIRIVPSEEVDWTEPPEGFTRPMRRKFQRRRKFYMEEYKMPERLAWYDAVKRTIREFEKGR